MLTQKVFHPICFQKFPAKSLAVLLIPLLALAIFQFLVAPVLAQVQMKSIEITYVYNLADKEVEDGDIVVTNSQGSLVRAVVSLDQRLFGVVQNQPLVSYRNIDGQGTPVARYGIAQVNATTLGGPINPGDYITSSQIPGKGQKANRSGYVLGTALTSLSKEDGQQIDFQSNKVTAGKVTVALRIEYAELSSARSLARLFDYFDAAILRSLRDPENSIQVFRYLAAAMVTLLSFAIGFFSFSKSIPKGIEAIGRNPLARRTILFSMGMNVFLTLMIILAGIIAAIFILRI